MQIQKASRSKVKIKAGIQGCSGSGKTMSALLMAYGLCGNWHNVAIIDCEHHSASLYAHLGDYLVLNLPAPFSPERYIEAIRVCEQAGIEVIILDSISAEWGGSGGILDIHGSMSGNSFTNWSKLTPRHDAFINAILQSPAHIIATIRTKQDYILVEKNGRQVPEKVGLKGIMRQDTDYDLTIVFDINIRHYATVSKDRTGIFAGKQEFIITANTGRQIIDWCNQGIAPEPDRDTFTEQISACMNIAELNRLYVLHPEHQQTYQALFSRRKKELQPMAPVGGIAHSPLKIVHAPGSI